MLPARQGGDGLCDHHGGKGGPGIIDKALLIPLDGHHVGVLRDGIEGFVPLRRHVTHRVVRPEPGQVGVDAGLVGPSDRVDEGVIQRCAFRDGNHDCLLPSRTPS